MKRITIPARSEYLGDLFDFISICAQSISLAEEKCQNLLTVAEEIFINIASYAYRCEKGDVKVIVKIESGQIIVEFRDRGKPFNPLSLADINSRKIGGNGILMIKEMSDEVLYKYCDEENILIIRQNI